MKHSNLVGIDVSESSIKVLQLDNHNSIVAYGSTILPDGVVRKGYILDKEAFSGALNNVLKNTRPNILHKEDSSLRAVLCLPESKLFSHHCIVPDEIKSVDIEEYILADALNIIPFELDSLYYKYHVAEEDGIRSATFVGVVKEDLDNYVKAFTYAKIQPEFVRGELFALGQALLPDPPFPEDYIVLDIGAHSATVGIFSVDSVPNASILIQQGGEYFTQRLAMWLGTSHEEAEQQKRQYGVNPAHEDTGVPKILRESLTSLVDKVIEAKTYFENKTGNHIQHIVMTGGSALMPYLNTFISEKIGVNTYVADPFLKVGGREQFEDNTPGIFYANVIGLALCATQDDLSDINLLAQYQTDKKDSEKESLSVRDIRSFGDFYHAISNLARKVGKIRVVTFFSTELKNLKIKLNLKLFMTISLMLGAVVFLVWVLVVYL